MKTLEIILYSLLAFAIALYLPFTVRAETRITDGYLNQDTTWDRSGSPYILEDYITIPKNITLKINPGVEVVQSSTLSELVNFYVNGTLNIVGSPESPVKLSKFWGISVDNGLANISDAIFDVTDGLFFMNSKANISSTSITNAQAGIQSKASTLKISNSIFRNNNVGIYQFSNAPVFQTKADELWGRGGEGNLYAQSNTEPSISSSSISISNSSFISNLANSIKNEDTETIVATDNWWGQSSGPTLSGQNSIKGKVEYRPWKTIDPLETISKPDCCSSVLFIPGLQGTRLYTDTVLRMGFGTSTNTLWEPNRNDDVRKLSMNTNGESQNPNTYSGLPIDKILGIYGVYGKFMNFLNGLKKDGSISEWRHFGYDWRQSIEDVVTKPASKGNYTYASLLNTVQDMASSSPTGKVSIIAHSNGGLVTKYLIKKLSEMGKSDLIDKVISVAVPYIGTPKAILSMLHGTDQSIAAGIILSESVARSLGENMPSAYSLLPSKEYFSKILSPTIAFASTTIPGLNKGGYPQNINTYDDQSAFLADTKNERKKPSSFDTDSPIEVNKTLLSSATALHDILDSYIWPTNIFTIGIVGWNKLTASGISYLTGEECAVQILKISCVSNRPLTTSMGDGTVVSPSASYGSEKIVAVDLSKQSEIEGKNISHANILESSTTQKIIRDIITDKTTDSLVGVSLGEPPRIGDQTSLLLSTHSPVDLHVYDEKGRHTGPIPKPQEAGDVEDGLYRFYDEDIINSTFTQLGSAGDLDTYISLPDKDNKEYTAVIKGTGFGEFTYEVERNGSSNTLSKYVISSVPVTPFTVATTTVRSNNSDVVTSTSSLPIISGKMYVDIDGDGKTDIVATSSTKIDGKLYMESLRKVAIELYGTNKKSKLLQDRFDKIFSQISKGRLHNFKDLADKISKRIGHKERASLTAQDKKTILDMIETFVGQFD
jgi:hypothetical protein